MSIEVSSPRIPITRPFLGAEEEEAVIAVLRSGWVSQGPRVEEFENAVASYVGARQAIATTNCTTALHLALIAAGVEPGDEVICPSFTFIATANAILQAGATPRFVDIDERTFNLDPKLIEAAITSRTKAIVPVDQIGLAAEIPAICAIARRHGLAVVEDAAPSLGATVGGSRVGSLSDFTCFSFHPRKSITTGEGGMITTNNEEAAERLRQLRSHAASTSAIARHESNSGDFEEYRELGYNYRMTDIQAAIGIVQMRRLEEILAERRRLAQRYDDLFKYSALATPFEPPNRKHTYQSYCITLRTPAARSKIMVELAARGIATRRGVMAIHQEPFYRAQFPSTLLPVTERSAQCTILLPLFVGMSELEQDRVVEAVNRSLRTPGQNS